MGLLMPRSISPGSLKSNSEFSDFSDFCNMNFALFRAMSIAPSSAGSGRCRRRQLGFDLHQALGDVLRVNRELTLRDGVADLVDALLVDRWDVLHHGVDGVEEGLSMRHLAGVDRIRGGRRRRVPGLGAARR